MRHRNIAVEDLLTLRASLLSNFFVSEKTMTRRDAIQEELKVFGFAMEYDAGAIPGEAHNLIDLKTGEAVEEIDPAIEEKVGALVLEWSELTDRVEDDPSFEG